MRRIHEKGFTLLELMITISIIVVIAAIVMVALSESREHSKNTARVAQIKEYQKAFNLYWSQTGHYPCTFANCPTGSSFQEACLGDYPPIGYGSGTCYNGKPERPIFASTFIPDYMGQMPIGETTTFGNNGAYTGMLYRVGAGGKFYQILYFMEGNNKDCLLDGATGTNTGPDTLCTLVVGP